jgi:hypothetical protein
MAGLQHPTNAIQLETGRTHRQTSQYYNAKDYSFTEQQWSTGSTHDMFQALTVM